MVSLKVAVSETDRFPGTGIISIDFVGHPTVAKK